MSSEAKPFACSLIFTKPVRQQPPLPTKLRKKKKMKIMNWPQFWAVFIAGASAVSITFYDANIGNCVGGRVGPNPTCNNIARFRCCGAERAGEYVVRSASFTGLSSFALGNVYKRQYAGVSRQCAGPICHRGAGSNLCLSCLQTGGNPIYIRGAEWVSSCRKRDANSTDDTELEGVEAQREPSQCQEPNYMTVGDRYFKVGAEHGVPENITQMWWDMFSSGQRWTEEEVPNYLREFEVAKEDLPNNVDEGPASC